MKRSVLSLALIASAIVLSGCAQKFTRERFNMIRQGVDTREDVRAMLGDPRFDLEDQWYFEDEDGYTSATVYFGADGRVTGKEWMDANTQEWSGQNPHANPPPEGEVRQRTKTSRRIDD